MDTPPHAAIRINAHLRTNTPHDGVLARASLAAGRAKNTTHSAQDKRTIGNGIARHICLVPVTSSRQVAPTKSHPRRGARGEDDVDTGRRYHASRAKTAPHQHSMSAACGLRTALQELSICMPRTITNAAAETGQKSLEYARQRSRMRCLIVCCARRSKTQRTDASLMRAATHSYAARQPVSSWPPGRLRAQSSVCAHATALCVCRFLQSTRLSTDAIPEDSRRNARPACRCPHACSSFLARLLQVMHFRRLHRLG